MRILTNISKQQVCITLFSFMMLGCINRNDNQALTNYIEKVIKDHLPQSTTIFALIPDNQCKYCIQYDENDIPERIKDRVIIISSFPKNHFKNFSQYYYAPSDEMLRLKALDYGNRIIVVENSRIKSVLNFTDFNKQMDSLRNITIVN